MELNKIIKMIHELAVSKGWWRKRWWWNKKRDIPTLLCLIHSEVSEAMEAYRNRNDDNFREELADVAIRLFDMSATLDIDLQEEILKKHNKNITRPYRHGNKRC